MFEGNFLPTGVGSLPFTDGKKAVDVILKTTPEIPYWPQLTQASFNENMYVQFAYNLPNIVVETHNKRLYVGGRERKGEAVLSNYLSGNLEFFKYDPRYFRGLYTFFEMKDKIKPKAVKGQVTGPLSLGLQVADLEKRPILYDDSYREIMLKNLCMMARWQEEQLKKISETTVISVDEPYLGSIGSGYLALKREDVISYMGEVLSSIKGLKGIHCCVNTDWSLVLETSIDVVFFDAYLDAKNLFLYMKDVRDFFSKGGIIAWGIVPNQSEALANESIETISKKLGDIISTLERNGMKKRDVLYQSLVTTSCGLGSLNEKDTLKALDLLRELSLKIRKEYQLCS